MRKVQGNDFASAHGPLLSPVDQVGVVVALRLCEKFAN